MIAQPKTILHLTAPRFFGGPERQVLELAQSLQPSYRTVFASFSEEGLCGPFLSEASRLGFAAIRLAHDTPALHRARQDIETLLRDVQADVLCCHGYKANILGLLAARRVRTPVVAVSRGWTAETLRVRFYEALDRWSLRWMDKVVCVSEGQARKVLRCGIAPRRTIVIHNAIRTGRFAKRKDDYRGRLLALFTNRPRLIVGAAGRLSHEKGFDVLIDAAAKVIHRDNSVGFVVFGGGAMHDRLKMNIAARGIENSFVLAGFHEDLDCYMPHFDLFVLPSRTEGLPNVALESLAAGVPVVATTVGGNPEVVADGVTGYLVPPADSPALAERLLKMTRDERQRRSMGAQGPCDMRKRFSFASQAKAYRKLFDTLPLSPTKHDALAETN